MINIGLKDGKAAQHENLRMRKLGYIRTSTDKQLNDRQINQLNRICDAVYVEDGVSAAGKNRPVYQQIIADLKQGDVFVVVSLDRAYRSVIDALIELEKLQALGVEFCSLTQNFDTRTPEGKLLYTVSAALAEWERAILRQRTREGMKAAKARGSIIGRPSILCAEHVQWAAHQRRQGQTIRKLARALKVSPSTLSRALKKYKP